jgi:hypothetical protein
MSESGRDQGSDFYDSTILNILSTQAFSWARGKIRAGCFLRGEFDERRVCLQRTTEKN